MEARQLPGKIFWPFWGESGQLAYCTSVRAIVECARLGLAVVVVRAVDRVALGGAGMGEFRRWLRSRNLVASFLPASRLLSFVCPIVSTCRILCRACGVAGLKGNRINA